MKLGIVTLCAFAFGALLTLPQRAVSQDSSAGSKLEVHLHYTGSGTVDEKHKIYAVLWDSPDFMQGGGMPVDMQSSSSKDGVVTFNNVQKTPAYVSAVFDPSGEWDAQSAPPEGSSLGLYSKTPGKPEPIDLKAGKTTSIDLPFDDTVKMRSGGPAR